MWWNVCAQRLDLGLYSLQESTLVPENVWKTSYWETTFVCLLVALCPSNMLVYLRDRSAQTTAHAATLRQKMQIKLSISPSHSILILSWQVPVLTLKRHAPGKAGTGVPISKSPVWPDPPPPLPPKKSTGQAGFKPTLEVDAFTTRPTRWYWEANWVCHSLPLVDEVSIA